MIKYLYSFLYMILIKKKLVPLGMYISPKLTKLKLGRFVKLGKVKLSGEVLLYDHTFLDDGVHLRGRVVVGQGTAINKNVELIGDIEIGKYCAFAREVLVQTDIHDYNRLALQHRFQHNVLKINPGVIKKKVLIGSDVWIGARAIILGGVEIGDGAIIGAGAVVTKDIPPYSIAVGVPAKVISYRFSPDKVATLKNLSWWDLPEDKLIEIKNFFSSDFSVMTDNQVKDQLQELK